MKGLLREPLVHFLLIGAALFGVQAWCGGPTQVAAPPPGAPDARIVVAGDTVARMEQQFARTWQRPPTDEEREALVEDHVRTEVFCREAIALGLDRDDEVLRRRLRMQMEFILEDVTAWADPTDGDLQAFLDGHREKYLTEPRLAFRQVFVATDARGADAASEAERILARLAAGSDPGSAGDPTQLPAEVPCSPLRDIRAQFGDGFARGLLDAGQGAWTGPVRSGYGLHLVHVTERVDGTLPALGDIREAVKRDWTAAKQRDMKDAAYARMRRRYTVTVEKPGPGAPSPAAAPGPGGTPR